MSSEPPKTPGRKRPAARRVRLAAFGVVVLAAAALVLWPSGRQADVRALLERGAAELNARPGEAPEARAARLERALPGLLTTDAQLVIPGFRVAVGPEEIVRVAVEQRTASGPVISISSAEVRLDARHHATARFEVVLSDSGAPDLHSARRRGNAELVEAEGQWRLRSLSVAPAADAEPEPRP